MDIILLHGALGSKKHFDALLPKFNAEFNIYSFDFEGHGDKASEREFSIELFVSNLIDYIDFHKLTKPNVFGYSMGGYVAMKAAIDFPDHIGKIVTLGTKVDWSLAAAEKEVKMLNPDIIQQKLPAYVQLLEAEHTFNDWKIVMQKTAKMMVELANGKKIKDEDFGKIKQAVIVGIGSLDNMVSLQEAEWLSGILPNGRLSLLNDCPHPINKIETDVLFNFITTSMVE